MPCVLSRIKRKLIDQINECFKLNSPQMRSPLGFMEFYNILTLRIYTHKTVSMYNKVPKTCAVSKYVLYVCVVYLLG